MAAHLAGRPSPGVAPAPGAADPTEPPVPAELVPTPRTRIRRLAEKTVTDRGALHAILDAGRVAHVGFTDPEHGPVVLPMGYARDGDQVLVHGSTGSRLMRGLATGAPACLTVTLLDGLVLARSAFESSMNYRCVMAFGAFSTLDGDAKLDGLRLLTEHLLPGRWDRLRPPHQRELAATLVLALPLTECSVKVSDGPPDDPAEDADWPVWAGVLPIRESYGPPRPAPDLPAGLIDTPNPGGALTAPDQREW